MGSSFGCALRFRTSDRGTADAAGPNVSLLARMIRRHPVACYFALAFAISWGGIVAVVGPTNILATKQVFESLAWVPPLLLGPSLSGIAVMAAIDGRPGLRALRARMFRARVGARWYAVALLTAPLYYLAVSLVLSRFSQAFLPALVTVDDPVGAVARAFIVGLSAGFFEELGWTGFAVPKLLSRRSVFATGTIVGALWGAWHIVPKLLGERAMDTLAYAPIDLLSAIVALTGFRILMVWVYERTQSLLLAILMHASLTAGLFVAQPAVTGVPAVTLGVAQAIAVWLLVGAVALVHQFRERSSSSSTTCPT